MKNLLLLAIFFFLGLFINAQNVELYMLPENVETLVRNTDYVLSEPYLIDNSVDLPGVNEYNGVFDDAFIQDEHDSEIIENYWYDNFELKAELGFGKHSRFISLPLAFYYKNFVVSATIPFYFQRRAEYSHGIVSAYGLGDLFVKSAYRIRKTNLYQEFNIGVNIPTGNQNKVSDGYLVPLGTGSYDFIVSNIFTYRHSSSRFYSNLAYRISGESSRTIMINYPSIPGQEIINYRIQNGKTFICNLAYNHILKNDFGLWAGFAFVHNSSGWMHRHQSYTWKDEEVNLEFLSAEQELLALDVKIGLSLSLFSSDFVFILGYPLYSDYNYNNIIINEGLTYYIKLSRNIF